MKSIYFLAILLITGLTFTGCRPDGFEPVGDANDNITPLAGTWKLIKVTQTDAESQRKGFPYAVEDITSLLAIPPCNSPSTLAMARLAPSPSTMVLHLLLLLLHQVPGPWTMQKPRKPFH